MKIYEQAQRLGADIQMEQVIKASLASPVKTLQTNGGEYKGKSVIIANGVKRRTLDCPGEKELTGKGVSYCATCDGAFSGAKPRRSSAGEIPPWKTLSFCPISAKASF